MILFFTTANNQPGFRNSAESLFFCFFESLLISMRDQGADHW